jgi:restriction system protein
VLPSWPGAPSLFNDPDRVPNRGATYGSAIVAARRSERARGQAVKLTNDDCDALDREIDLLSGDANLGWMAAEDTYGRILEPLLLQEGYELKQTPRTRDSGIDFYGERKTASDSLEPETCGIQVKYYRRSINVDQVRSMIGAAIFQNITRALLVSNSDFTRSAREAVAREMPLKVELLGLSDLRNWVARFRVETPDIEAEVRVILRDLSARLARMIALDKSTLAYLEWRDVERVVAEVFDGLGFQVSLTPGSKDGGKDVVLSCTAIGRQAEYYVEIKHWRSSTKVGSGAVEKLLKVIVEQKKDGACFSRPTVSRPMPSSS